MQKNRIGNQKTIGNSLGKILAALVVMFALAGSVQVVEAKVYYTLYDVRYIHDEIPSSVKEYINYVEYDIPSPWIPGYDYGVRLYLTEKGRLAVKQGGSPLVSVTAYVTGNPEWYAERSFNSVGAEIWYHSVWGKTTIHIQYHYLDLESWEYPFYGRL